MKWQHLGLFIDAAKAGGVLDDSSIRGWRGGPFLHPEDFTFPPPPRGEVVCPSFNPSFLLASHLA